MSSAPQWVFTRRFRANAFGWKASRLAATRLREAVTEIRAAARHDAERGLTGAVLLTERFVAAVCGVDDSWGILGTAIAKQYERLIPVFKAESVSQEARLASLRRVLDAWLADEYGYLDLIPQMVPLFVASAADAGLLVPEFESAADAYGAEASVLQEHSSGPHGWSFEATRARVRAEAYRQMATEIQLRFLDAEQALHSALEHDFCDGGATLIRALLKQGRTDDARAVIESRRFAPGEQADVDGPWFSLLIEAGEFEHAREAGVVWLSRKATLERFRKVVKALPDVDRGRLAHDAIARTPVAEKGRWFATLNHLGLHDEAAQLAREHVIAPETALRAAQKYEEAQPVLAFESYIAAVRGFVSWGEIQNDAYIAYSVVAPARRFAKRIARDEKMVARLLAVKGLEEYPGAWNAAGGVV